MLLSNRSFRCFPVQCSVTYNAGLFVKRLLAVLTLISADPLRAQRLGRRGAAAPPVPRKNRSATVSILYRLVTHG